MLPKVLAILKRAGVGNPPMKGDELRRARKRYRRAAAGALSDIASPGVVGQLAKVALQHGDERVRFLAVRGPTDAGSAPRSNHFRGHRRKTSANSIRRQADVFFENSAQSRLSGYRYRYGMP